MSRKKTQEELEREAQEADEKYSAIAKKQSECSHWNCQPTEWHFSGSPRTMRCDDCDAENYLEEPQS